MIAFPDAVDVRDQELRRRLARAVETAIHTAQLGQIDRDRGDIPDHISVWWSWKSEADTSAQRTVHPGGRVDYAVYVESEDDPDAGPWLISLDVSSTRFMPGAGFSTAAEFLDWFEAPSLAPREVAPC